MDKYIEYLKNNPEYVTALIVTLVVIVAAAILGFFIKKYNLLKFMDKWFKSDNKNTADSQTEGDATAQKSDKQPTETSDNESQTHTLADAPIIVLSDQIDENCNDFDDDFIPEEDEHIDELEITPEVPTKRSKFSEMLHESLKTGAAEEYEEQRKQTTAPKIIVKQETDRPTPIQDEPNEEIEGKWNIIKTGNTYLAELHNDQGDLLIKTQNYSALSGVKKGIESLKANIKGNNFTISVDKNGKFFFKLFTPSNRFVANGEPCDTNDDCKKRIEEVKRIAFKAEIVRG